MLQQLPKVLDLDDLDDYRNDLRRQLQAVSSETLGVFVYGIFMASLPGSRLNSLFVICLRSQKHFTRKFWKTTMLMCR